MNPEDTELYENMTGEDCFAVYEETAKRLGADPLKDGYELFIGDRLLFICLILLITRDWLWIFRDSIRPFFRMRIF